MHCGKGLIRSLKELRVGKYPAAVPAAEEPERRRQEAEGADEEVEARQRQSQLPQNDLQQTVVP